MLCPNCQLEFNSTTNLPRILIFCGHTYCHNCIENLITQSQAGKQDQEQTQRVQLNCPECGTVNQANDGINSFPKNLVLLQVNSNQQNQQINQSAQLNKQTSNQEIKVKDNQNQKSKQDINKAICNLHHKKLEAFCEKDLQVLCIDCILSEQHKSHEIISVQKAAEKQKQYLYDEVTSAQKTEEKLKFIQSDIKRHIGEMHSQAEKNRKELSSIYSYLRDLLLERESMLKRQISENLVREEQESDGKYQEISDFMSSINSLKLELVSQNSESEIEILQKAKQRAIISSEVNGLKSRELTTFNLNQIVQSSQSLTEIKRDQELGVISKIINPTYKGPQIGQGIGGGNNGSSLYQHTQSTASKMKKQNTLGLVQMSMPSGNLQMQNQVSSSVGSLMTQDKNAVFKEDIRKSTKLNQGQVKAKISPHRPANTKRPLQQDISNKKPVVILDQNKQKSNQKYSYNAGKIGNQTSFNNHNNPSGILHNQINLYNYNQNSNTNIDGENSEEVIGTMGGDDMSSIYPLETNDCFFQYQDGLLPGYKNGNGNKRDGSVGALNDLLESLNKSGCIQTDGADPKCSNSTASETGGSHHSDVKTPPVQDFKLGKQLSNNPNTVKSNIETPKGKKVNPWSKCGGGNNNISSQQNQKSKSSKKKGQALKKDHSASDLKQQNQDNSYYGGGFVEERKSGQKNNCGGGGSLNRYNSNNNILSNQQQEGEEQKVVQQQMPNPLSSLSQERAKRKQQKQLVSQEQSPFKLEKLNKDKQVVPLMDMLSECTKNIEKLEFRTKKTSLQHSQQDSPVKLPAGVTSNKAAVCVVDLTRRDDFTEIDTPLRLSEPNNVLLPLKLHDISQTEDKVDAIQENEEEVEGGIEQISSSRKRLPNMTNQKDSSPFKNKQLLVGNVYSGSYQSSPQKIGPIMQSSESLDNIVHNQLSGKHSDTSLDLSVKQNPFNLVAAQKQIQSPSVNSNNNLAPFQQQSVSVDTSLMSVDPLRAFCKNKEEFIFVFSGFNDSKLLTCEALDVQRGAWKEIAQIQKARTKFSAVPISKSRILIFGGKQADGQRTGEIEEYNLKTNKFKTLPFKLPKPRSGFAACVKREEGKIFFCGGNSGSVLKKFDCLDLKKGKWSRWPEMLQKRDELAVSLGPDGNIYAIGGYGGSSSSQQQEQDNSQIKDKQQNSNCLRTAERFDFNTGQWEMLPEMNEARRALAAVALPDGIYAIGGYDGKQYLSSVEKFDLQKQQWIKMKSMNTSRCTLSAVASSDCQYIYVLGGFNGNSLDLVERYNTMTDEWEYVTPMISKRFMHEAVCLITH